MFVPLCVTFPVFQVFSQKYLQIFRHEQDVAGYLTHAMVLSTLNAFKNSTRQKKP